MPPMRIEPTCLGENGSLTSYCLSSPVPQHDTYRNRSSSDRSMSLMSGGTALNGLSAGGSTPSSAGSAGMVIVFFALNVPLSRYHVQTDPDRSAVLITTPAKPYCFVGSCA